MSFVAFCRMRHVNENIPVLAVAVAVETVGAVAAATVGARQDLLPSLRGQKAGKV